MKKYGLNMTAISFLLLLAAMLIFPEASIKGAARGMNIWWQYAVPSLLPFFIISDILLASGLFAGLYPLLKPLCRLFRLPVKASPAILLGLVSGFPTGAAITSELLQNNSIDQQQASRLLCFTNNCSPLFISGTVCTALFTCPAAIPYMLAIHYGISLIYGFIAARISYNAIPAADIFTDIAVNDSRSLGILLKNASLKAITRISLIGCYLIFFSLLGGIMNNLFFDRLPYILPADAAALLQALLLGMTEMTIGAASAIDCRFDIAFALTAGLMSFGGLSVMMQVYAMLPEQKPSFKPYIISCCIKGIAAFLLALPIGHSLNINTAAGIHYMQPSPLIASLLAATFMLLLSLSGIKKDRSK